MRVENKAMLLTGEAQWYNEAEALDVARHIGKMINEETGIIGKLPKDQYTEAFKTDLISMVTQLRAAVDKVSMLEQFHYDMMNPETGEFLALEAQIKELSIGKT